MEVWRKKVVRAGAVPIIALAEAGMTSESVADLLRNSVGRAKAVMW